MKFNSALVLGLAAALTYAECKGASVPVTKTDNWNVNVSVDVDWQTLAKAGKSIGRGVKKVYQRIGTRDPEIQQVRSINGKMVVLVSVIQPRDTRITHNINFDPAWRKTSRLRVLLANVPKNQDPRGMAFQMKYDEDWGSDPTIGPVMRHGDVVDFEPGHGRYMAKRTDTVFSGATIVFADASLSPSELATLPGITVAK